MLYSPPPLPETKQNGVSFKIPPPSNAREILLSLQGRGKICFSHDLNEKIILKCLKFTIPFFGISCHGNKKKQESWCNKGEKA